MTGPGGDGNHSNTMQQKGRKGEGRPASHKMGRRQAGCIYLLLLLTCLLFEGGVSIGETPYQLCPVECTCQHAVKLVKCTNLMVIPSNIPTDVERLILPNNNFKSIDNQTFSSFLKLRQLDLQNCSIRHISDDAFANSWQLSLLILSDNFLTAKHLTSLAPLAGLDVLDLSSNNIDNTRLNNASFFWPNLRRLNLSYNGLTEFNDGVTIKYSQKLLGLHLQNNRLMNIKIDATLPLLKELDLSNNRLFNVTIGDVHLQILNLENNQLNTLEGIQMDHPNSITQLKLTHNPLDRVVNSAFSNYSNINILHLNDMARLRLLEPDAFRGLSSLWALHINRNRRLRVIPSSLFSGLERLQVLDLSDNGVSFLQPAVFANISTLKDLSLQGNPWSCGCGLQLLQKWIQLNLRIVKEAESIQCIFPPSLDGISIVDVDPKNFSCHSAKITNYTQTAYFKIGSQAVLNCIVHGHPSPKVTWVTPASHLTLHYDPKVISSKEDWDPEFKSFHDKHEWHRTDYKMEHEKVEDRIHVLDNGSLYIDYVTRRDAGNYTCFVENDLGNDTTIIQVRLNYLIILETTVISMVVGCCSAMGFLCIALVFALVKFLAHKCSHEQRQKRKSIKDILEGMEAYRTHKIDKLSAYKTAKIDQISAYKSAKFGQLSAYKSHKMGQISAFKTAKVDQLRNYRNLTMSNMIQYIKGMREHYASQVNRVKENCTQQAMKVRENYNLKMVNFKDYRSQHIDRARDNYNGQVQRIRDYGSQQLERLREQYKTQQQYLMKLMEILNMTNCIHVVEAECMRTESMLFDPDMDWDFYDNHPVHPARPPILEEEGEESDYQSASSKTDLSFTHEPRTTSSFEANRSSSLDRDQIRVQIDSNASCDAGEKDTRQTVIESENSNVSDCDSQTGISFRSARGSFDEVAEGNIEQTHVNDARDQKQHEQACDEGESIV